MKIKIVVVVDTSVTFHQKKFSRDTELCTRDEFMSGFHIILVPGSIKAQIKFNEYNYRTKVPFVINASLEFMLEPLGRQVKRIALSQQHKVCDSLQSSSRLTLILIYKP